MSSQKLELKLATVDDIDVIYSLADKIWHHHYVPIVGLDQVDYMLGKMYSNDELVEQMTEKKHRFYLINLNNKQIGFVAISSDKDVFIHKFYIDQDLQGKGYGKEVFSLLRVLNPNAFSYTLTVNRNNFKAINFYFKLGFVIDRIEDFDIGSGYYMNDFIMKLKI